MHILLEEAPLLVYYFLTLFLSNYKLRLIFIHFLDHINLLSIGAPLLTSFAALAGMLPCSLRLLRSRGTLPCSLCSLRSRGSLPCSLRSLSSQGTLPCSLHLLCSRGMLPCSLCSLCSRETLPCSLRSLRSQGVLPTVTFDIFAHSLRSFTLISKAPSGRLSVYCTHCGR